MRRVRWSPVLGNDSQAILEGTQRGLIGTVKSSSQLIFMFLLHRNGIYYIFFFTYLIKYFTN